MDFEVPSYNRRLLRLIVPAVVVIVLLLAWAMMPARDEHEPKYHGRTLSSWAEQYIDAARSIPATPGSTRDLRDAENAIRAIGTNGIPALLDWLDTRDSRFKNWARYTCLRTFQVNLFSETDEQIHDRAWFTFSVLTNQAAPAIPFLVQRLENPQYEQKEWAMNCLNIIGPDKSVLFPVLLHTMKDADLAVSSHAARYIIQRYPEEIVNAGVYQKFPQLKPVN